MDGDREEKGEYRYSGNGDQIEEKLTTPQDEFTQELYLHPGNYLVGSLTNTRTTTYTYDNAGNLRKTDSVDKLDGTITDLKMNDESLIDIPDETIDSVTHKTRSGDYYYDGDGMRAQKKDYLETSTEIQNNWNSAYTEQNYFYIGSTLLFSMDLNGGKLMENVIDPYGNTLMSKRFEAATLPTGEATNDTDYFTFNEDIRGSVTNILRPDGTLCTGYVYDEFGNQIKTGDKDFLNEAAYTGAIFDEESGLHYMNARYYNSETGRFISRDSYLGDMYQPWTQHLYSYTGNNPVNYIDPTGHFGILALMGIGFFVGGVFGGISAAFSGGDVFTGVLLGGFGGALSMYAPAVAVQAVGLTASALSATTSAAALYGPTIAAAAASGVGNMVVNYAAQRESGKSISEVDYAAVGASGITGSAWGMFTTTVKTPASGTLIWDSMMTVWGAEGMLFTDLAYGYFDEGKISKYAQKIKIPKYIPRVHTENKAGGGATTVFDPKRKTKYVM